jgi:hypothetical protein
MKLAPHREWLADIEADAPRELAPGPADLRFRTVATHIPS